MAIPSTSTDNHHGHSRHGSTSSGSSMLSASTEDQTNTIAITNIPSSWFLQPPPGSHPPQPVHASAPMMDVMKRHFGQYGQIALFVPLKSFRRVLVVYFDPVAAERAKEKCDWCVFEDPQDRTQVTLRVFRADYTHIPAQPTTFSSFGSAFDQLGQDPTQSTSFQFQIDYLRPPNIEKNFLISPPGSPPVGWEPIHEDPPNATPLADDLVAALKTLQLSQRQQGVEVLLEPHEGAGVGVYVEDCDKDGEGMEVDEEVDDSRWVYGETMPTRQKWAPIPTAMPPMSAMRSVVVL